MFASRYTILTVVALAVTSMLVTPKPSIAEDEQALIGVLQSDAPQADKAITCKKLALWGTADSVPALAALLPDPELTSWARVALEAIPDSAADAALRDALDKTEGLQLVGVINSIGVRGDATAVEALVKHLGDDDAEVAKAAAAALGKIGGDEATAALRGALADDREGVRSTTAEGCILCAERQLAAGNAEQATALYDEVRAADVPKPRVVEATRGAILARGADGVPMLLEQLASGDRAMVNVALTTARELSGPGVSKQLMTALADVSADEQPRLVLAMADRQDAEALPAVLESAQSAPTGVRIAALEVLRSMGDASCLPVLLGIASEDDPQVVDAAMATLEALPGDDVNDDLVAGLATAKGAERLALLKLVGMRRIDAVPPLREAIDDADAQVRAAALTALGEVAGLDDVSILIDRTLDPPYAEDAPVALAALQAACVRMPEREACAEKLATALDNASAEAKDAILETLAAMGGERALQTMRTVAMSDDQQLQDISTRLLGSWMSVDAGPVLLELATDADGRYKTRALRGYIRLARQFGMSDAERAQMCRQAWEAAERGPERKLVSQVIERYPSVDMLPVALAVAKSPEFQTVATTVATAVADKLGGAIDADELLELAGQGPVQIEIVKATYGAGDKQKDVTDLLRRHVGETPLVVMPAESYNSSLGGDPAPGVTKTLRVEYRIDGKEGEATFAENTPILVLKVSK